MDIEKEITKIQEGILRHPYGSIKTGDPGKDDDLESLLGDMDQLCEEVKPYVKGR